MSGTQYSREPAFDAIINMVVRYLESTGYRVVKDQVAPQHNPIFGAIPQIQTAPIPVTPMPVPIGGTGTCEYIPTRGKNSDTNTPCGSKTLPGSTRCKSCSTKGPGKQGVVPHFQPQPLQQYQQMTTIPGLTIPLLPVQAQPIQAPAPTSAPVQAPTLPTLPFTFSIPKPLKPTTPVSAKPLPDNVGVKNHMDFLVEETNGLMIDRTKAEITSKLVTTPEGKQVLPLTEDDKKHANDVYGQRFTIGEMPTIESQSLVIPELTIPILPSYDEEEVGELPTLTIN